MARVTSEVEMVVEAFARSAAVLLLPMLALACIVSDSGPVATLGVWLTWMVLALGIDAVSPRVGRTRAAAGSTIKALVYQRTAVSATVDQRHPAKGQPRSRSASEVPKGRPAPDDPPLSSPRSEVQAYS